ncbi:DUF2624 domain-containing protein [Virgibacillus sp. C22-A2]|uniref:DUF2624 domain-containing protein n=1 Tax=Virgibacillus tibetensis TaxID=3042313 RepID=A0ABU6KAW2_9BACI|nr:DUF2624 domain-containing protein [Virgibacillus sp. C22-A2]
MSTFIKDLITKKLKQLTPGELLHYGKQYGFKLTQEEAQQITTYLKNNRVDPFNTGGRKIMLKELAKITDVETAKKAQKLFDKLIKSYGLDHLFN